MFSVGQNIRGQIGQFDSELFDARSAANGNESAFGPKCAGWFCIDSLVTF